MRVSRSTQSLILNDDDGVKKWLRRHIATAFGFLLIAAAAALAAALATWTVGDPSLNHATDAEIQNALGKYGAIVADILIQMIGLAAGIILLPVVLWAWQLIFGHLLGIARRPIVAWIAGTVLAAGFCAVLPAPDSWALPTGLGGVIGDLALRLPVAVIGGPPTGLWSFVLGALYGIPAIAMFVYAAGWWRRDDLADDGETAMTAAAPVADDIDDDETEPGGISALLGAVAHWGLHTRAIARRLTGRRDRQRADAKPGLIASLRGLKDRLLPRDDDGLSDFYHGDRVEPSMAGEQAEDDWQDEEDYGEDNEEAPLQGSDAARKVQVTKPTTSLKQGKRIRREAQRSLLALEAFEFPPMHLLAEPKQVSGKPGLSAQALEQNARLLEGVLEDFGVPRRNHRRASRTGRHPL